MFGVHHHILSPCETSLIAILKQYFPTWLQIGFTSHLNDVNFPFMMVPSVLIQNKQQLVWYLLGNWCPFLMSTRRDRYTKHEERVINFLLPMVSQSLAVFHLMIIHSSKELCIVYVRTLPPFKHEMRHLTLYPNVKPEAGNWLITVKGMSFWKRRNCSVAPRHLPCLARKSWQE